MRSYARFLGLAAAVATLSGCNQAQSPLTSAHHGRYTGVGIYGPEDVWRRLARTGQSTDKAARPIDDEAIIVVEDSDTGEFRACGDLSGYCVGMNPWTKPLAQSAPINLDQHRKLEDPDATVVLESNSAKP